MKLHERDPKRMIDMIFVKRLERRLGRELTEFELEDHDEPIAFCFSNGQIELIQIPRLRFPHDVFSGLEGLGNKLKDETSGAENKRLQPSNEDQVRAA
jgi:hypothetical protein